MDERPGSYRQLIRLPNVLALLSAACLSRLADRMFAIAIVFHALAAFGSPTIAGWIAFAAVAPGLLISPLAGALLDRAGVLRSIVADLALSAVVALALATCIWFASATPAIVSVLAVTYALSSPLSAAGIRVLLPRLVPAPALDRANALDTVIHAIVDVAGPSVAGLLLGFVGPFATFIAIAAAYGGATLCVALLRSTPPPASPPSRGFFRQALQGLGFVAARPVLRGLAVGYALNMVAWGMLWVVLPVSVARNFDAGTWESISGLLWAGVGVAGGIGALVSGHLGMVGREVRWMTLCMVVMAFGVGLANAGLPGLVFGLLLVGLVSGPIDVGVLTLRQRCTDPTDLGRALAVSMSLNMSGWPIGAVLGGILVAWSPPLALLAAALASLLGAWSIYVLIPPDEAMGR
jgi:MFS family permease